MFISVVGMGIGKCTHNDQGLQLQPPRQNEGFVLGQPCCNYSPKGIQKRRKSWMRTLARKMLSMIWDADRLSSMAKLVFLAHCIAPAFGSMHGYRTSHLSEHLRSLLLTNSNNKIAERWAFLDTHFVAQRNGFQAMTLHDPQAVALLSPNYPCPYTMRKEPSTRHQFDGGKWVCGFDELGLRNVATGCVVYSAGSNGEDAFEREVNKAAPFCEIHVFDPTSKRLDAWKFDAVGLSHQEETLHHAGKTFPSKPLSSLMRHRNHSFIDILKVDIDGFEWNLLQHTDWKALCIGQVLVEIHDTAGNITLPTLLKQYIQPLESAGFRLYSLEPVCVTCKGQYELSFLHTEWSPTSGFDGRQCNVP